MTSLIQQRLSLDRSRTIALFGTITGTILIAIAMFATIEDPATWTSWGLLVVAFGIFVVNVSAYVKARQKLHAFETEHGRGAGTQRDS